MPRKSTIGAWPVRVDEAGDDEPAAARRAISRALVAGRDLGRRAHGDDRARRRSATAPSAITRRAASMVTTVPLRTTRSHAARAAAAGRDARPRRGQATPRATVTRRSVSCGSAGSCASKGSGSSSDMRSCRACGPAGRAMWTQMSPQNSQRICRQAPQGAVSRGESATTAIGVEARAAPRRPP